MSTMLSIYLYPFNCRFLLTAVHQLFFAVKYNEKQMLCQN